MRNRFVFGDRTRSWTCSGIVSLSFLVVVAGFRFKRESVLFVAASSTLAWYTVFIPPRFSFHIGTVEDALIFASFFAVAVAMGHLTSRLHLKEVAERMRERRTAALYELVQQAGLAADLDSGLTAAVKLTETLFGVRAALLLSRSEENLAVDAHPASSFELSEKDSAAAGVGVRHAPGCWEIYRESPERQCLASTLADRQRRHGSAFYSAGGWRGLRP